MDEAILTDEINLQNSPPKAKRRRSSFFEKRESIIPVPPNFEDSIPKIVEQGNPLGHKLQEEQLKIYYGKLIAEKDAWTQMYIERKENYAELQWKCSHEKPRKKTLDKSYSLLSEEDIEFLKAKPDIDKINSQAKKLCKDVEFTVQLKMELLRRNLKLVEHIKHTADEIQGNILNHSTVD